MGVGSMPRQDVHAAHAIRADAAQNAGETVRAVHTAPAIRHTRVRHDVLPSAGLQSVRIMRQRRLGAGGAHNSALTSRVAHTT